MPPITIAEAVQIALEHHRAGRLEQAEAIYRQVLQQQPDNHDAMQLLGALAYQVGRHESAVELISRSIQLAPNVAYSHNNLGSALLALGRIDEAIAAFLRSLALGPDQSDPHNNLADALADKGRFADAIGHYRKAISLRPEWPEAHNNLGHALHSLGHAEQAAEAFREALVQHPGFAEAHANLGNVLLETGQIAPAIASYRQAVRLKPDLAAARSNLVYALHFNAAISSKEIFDEHVNWARTHADPLAEQIRSHDNDRTPGRRLRIGYISQDFRDHPVGRFMLPILRAHDREQFELHCFSDVWIDDNLTRELCTHAAFWHETKRLSPENLAELVRREKIDILIDLAGHSGVHRLLTFALKPAPVQVSYLGYPDTTGLATIDYRITDALADPPGMTEDLHTEELIRLPNGFLCYRLPDDVPDVTPPPCVSNKGVTFGSFNNLAKMSPEVMKLWARILTAVPCSRLLIKAQALGDAATRNRVCDMLVASGIEARRIDVLGPESSHICHLAMYRQVDIALDTFPYNGTTSTCEALIMGVPVVTLAGRTHAGRMGASLLTRCGLGQWIAENADDYVRIAVDLASDRDRLVAVRSHLRGQTLESPLGDADMIARDLESAYREMWIKWSAS